MPLELNPEQQKAAHAPTNPLLIVAGAGTGKTRTLMSRLLSLLERGVLPGSICAITFTNKAAREMAERVLAYASPSVRGLERGRNDATGFSAIREKSPFIGTFHSLGARILRNEADFVGRSKNFVIFDDHDSFQLVKKIVKTIEERKSDIGPAHFANKISEIKNGSCTLTALKNSSRPSDGLALRIFARYENKLEEMNAFDFDDLLYKVLRVFKKHPLVLKKYREKFRHLLIDEYQDLNNVQYELVQLLAGSFSPHEGSLSVVGDDQQMIYGWRGSNIEIFLNFEKDWPSAQTILLEENYRSTGSIIAAASAVIQNNQRRADAWQNKTLWTKNPAGEAVRILEAANDDEEAEWLASEIKTTTRDYDDNKKRGDKNLGHSHRPEIAILYRTNAQSRPIEQALIMSEIPYRVFGGLKFYERREVKDVLAGLRYAFNPKDGLSRERLLKNFSKRDFLRFAGEIGDEKNLAPTGLIEIFLRATDYFAHLKKNFINASERQENVGSLIEFASNFADLEPFLEQISLLQANDELGRRQKEGEDISPVRLMTIHLAKGLEFDHVYIAGVCEGLLPHAKSMEEDERLEEERRLMYVAMTRAKKSLAISFYDLPSRFISEIPAELSAFESLVSEENQFSESEERHITLD